MWEKIYNQILTNNPEVSYFKGMYKKKNVFDVSPGKIVHKDIRINQKPNIMAPGEIKQMVVGEQELYFVSKKNAEHFALNYLKDIPVKVHQMISNDVKTMDTFISNTNNINALRS